MADAESVDLNDDVEWLDDESNGSCIAHLGVGLVETVEVGLDHRWIAKAEIETLILVDTTERDLEDAKGRSLQLWSMLAETTGLC